MKPRPPGWAVVSVRLLTFLAERMSANPRQFPVVFKNVRRALMRRFPYALFESNERWSVYLSPISHIMMARGSDMATTATSTIRARREAIVNAHIEAEAVNHDAAATVATFRHPRYEVPALAAIVDGAEAVNALVSGIVSAFPDFYLQKTALHHADDAVIVEARFGGTQHGTWAGIGPTGKTMEVQGVLIFVFEGDDLVCEKVYFDHATILRQLGVID